MCNFLKLFNYSIVYFSIVYYSIAMQPLALEFPSGLIKFLSYLIYTLQRESGRCVNTSLMEPFKIHNRRCHPDVLSSPPFQM